MMGLGNAEMPLVSPKTGEEMELEEQEDQERARPDRLPSPEHPDYVPPLGTVQNPLSVSWIIRSYVVTLYRNSWWRPFPKKMGERALLTNAVGTVDPGEFIALMGPSGSGKTTLINVLSGRVGKGSRVDGCVLIGDVRMNRDLGKHIAYVYQDDVLFPNLTVRETLRYSALLRLPREMPTSEKLAAVARVVGVLLLDKCADTRIGGGMERGVSGGERKRVCIAMELLANPTIMFLDEPTSGLDSALALQLVRILRRIAEDDHRTVICSIHQPSAPIFNTFHRLYLLSGGRVVFNDRVSEVGRFFADHGYPNPPGYNIADHMMEVIVQNPVAREELEGVYETTERYAAERAIMEEREARLVATEKRQNIPFYKRPFAHYHRYRHGERRFESSWRQQFTAILERTFRQQFKVIISNLNIIQVIVISVVAGLLWLQISHDEDAINDRIFFLLIFWSFTPLLSTIGSYPLERGVVWRDRMTRSYRMSSYFLAKFLAEVILTSVLPIINISIVYWMAGLSPEALDFFIFLGVVLLTGYIYQSFALFIGALVPQFQNAVVLASTVVLTFLLLGGFYIRNFQPWLLWTPFVSPIHYSFGIIMQSQFDMETFNCAPVNSQYPSCQTQDTFPGSEVFAVYNITPIPGVYVAYLVAFLIGFRFCAYVAIRARK